MVSDGQGWVSRRKTKLFTVYRLPFTPLHLTATMWRSSLSDFAQYPPGLLQGKSRNHGRRWCPMPHPCPTNAHPAPHDAKRIASYSIRQRLTRRGTLFLTISHSVRGMLYLCNVKTEQTLTAHPLTAHPVSYTHLTLPTNVNV